MAAAEQPKIKVHWLNESRAQSIIWLLEELGLTYEVQIYHRQKSLLAPPELARVHPLGKSPVIEITPVGGGAPVILAESGFITQYLGEHFAAGRPLVPPRWRPGAENQVAGETDAWMRYQYLLHYTEGSLMPVLVFSLILRQLKSNNVPFLVRPISSAIANRITAAYVFPNAKNHLAFLDGQLAASGGPYLCGEHLTGADILLSFPLSRAKDRLPEMGAWEGGSPRAAFPRLFEYMDRLEAEPGFVRAKAKMEELDKQAAGEGAESGAGGDSKI